MKTNPYGSFLSAETIAEIIVDRLVAASYPDFSDILGSDWSGTFPQSPNHYRGLDLAAARRIYDDYTGCLKV